MELKEPDPDVYKYLDELRSYSRSKDIIFKRFVSYDFCYNYFQNLRGKNEILDNLDLSCLQLGFYLASWGMYRGSGRQLLRSYKIYEKVIKLIAAEEELWNIDVSHYLHVEKRERIIKCKKKIVDILSDKCYNLYLYDGVDEETFKDKGKITETLATKIMMGTFGCVPALDINFKTYIHSGTLNKDTLIKIHSIYTTNQNEIDKFHLRTLDVNGKDTQHEYKKAKLIDYIGFRKGGKFNSEINDAKNDLKSKMITKEEFEELKRNLFKKYVYV